MSLLPDRLRILLSMATLGAFAQVAQALLIRDGLVAFYGNEISLGAFYASWLLWIALGSRLAAWLERWNVAPPRLLRGIILALPLALALELVLLRGVRLALDLPPAQLIPLGQLLASAFLIYLPLAMALGLVPPLASRLLAGGESGTVPAITGLYLFDALGALAGGVFFTFVLVEWLGVVATVGVTLLLAALALALLPGSRRWPEALLLVAGLAVSLPPLGTRLEQQLENWRFGLLQPGMGLVESGQTRFGHLAVARLGEQFSLLEDGRVAANFPDPAAIGQQAALVYSQADGAKRLLLFGGLASGLPVELLGYPLERIDLVEPDSAAQALVTRHFPPQWRRALEDPRLVLHPVDGRWFLRHGPDTQYDLVLALAADPSTAHGNRLFTQEFYQEVRQRLAPRGVFCTQVSGASHYLGGSVLNYGSALFQTLASVFREIALVPGEDNLLCASDHPGQVSESASELARRYQAIPLAKRRFPAAGFHSLLQPEEVAFARARLQRAEARVNSDARPVSYFLNMLLWGRFTDSRFVDWMERLERLGIWPWLIPPALFALLLVARGRLEGQAHAHRCRASASFALFVTGLAAMAVQLVLIFSYQAQIGHLFGRIALLNGLFMTGLALGAGLGQRLARRGEEVGRAALLSLLLAGAGALVLLPRLLASLATVEGLWREGLYLALCAGAGLLAGTLFPLAVAQTRLETQETLRTSAIANSADNLGGALGGLLTGAFLVPLLGIGDSCGLLALLSLCAALPVALAGWGRGRPGRMASFPWPRLSWGLFYLLACLYGLTLAAREDAPRPRVEFDDDSLAAAALPLPAEFRAAPFPHYSAGVGERELAAFASAPLAEGIRGYAGPIQLLITLGRDGQLRAVRYLASAETHSYIAGIDLWLAGLTPADLRNGPLSLEGYDALSGATVSSQAALATINAAARGASRQLWGLGVPPEAQGPAPWRAPDFWAVALLLLLFVPIYRSGRDRPRLLLQLMSLGLLGFGFNSLVTEIDLANLSLGLWPAAGNWTRWLLLGFVALSVPLFGPVWCGYLCPYGALQEFCSRLGRWHGWRRYAQRPLDQLLRYLKYLLLGALLAAVWLSGDPRWAGIDPMQKLFTGHPGFVLGALAALGLLGSLVFYRLWCRYLCPLGAALNLGNALAWLQRFGPQRKLERCDLGVRHPQDLDCIRCNRCIDGRDLGVRRHAEQPKS